MAKFLALQKSTNMGNESGCDQVQLFDNPSGWTDRFCILSAQFDMKATMPGQAFDDVGVSRVLVGGCSLFDK